MDLGLKGKSVIVTGAGGAICGKIAEGFAAEGANVAVWDISLEAAERQKDAITETGGRAIAVDCDATSREDVEAAFRATLSEFGTVEALVNGAGGSRKETTTSDELTFFDFRTEDLDRVMALNYLSAVIPSQVVGRHFSDQDGGSIVNISSIAGIHPVTRALSYSNGKAATNSFTEWLAVHMAQNYSGKIRVNAVAPGFILTEQNRFLLIDQKTGNMSPRGQQVVDTVPMARYGAPEEIVGAALWLSSASASFVTGTIIPVDGGLTAFLGV
ncbi:MAG: SDR family oxidoreductase [Spirochaetaceae bacterium]